jgi:hypothetical protein
MGASIAMPSSTTGPRTIGAVVPKLSAIFIVPIV